jgi:hypothetical protein
MAKPYIQSPSCIGLYEQGEVQGDDSNYYGQGNQNCLLVGKFTLSLDILTEI